jgi:hypothetical protein
MAYTSSLAATITVSHRNSIEDRRRSCSNNLKLHRYYSSNYQSGHLTRNYHFNLCLTVASVGRAGI